MPDPHRSLVLTAALVLGLVTVALAETAAETATETGTETVAEADVPAPPSKGFRADYLMEFARLQARTLALAEEIPAERYADRSGPETHTIAECLIELAAASRRALVGMEREAPAAAEAPADAEEREPAADKARIVAELTNVLAAVRQAVEETPDEGLEAPWDYLGRRWTTRALLLLILSQTHEDLGHAAAHAESVGVPPPWVKQRRVSEASVD